MEKISKEEFLSRVEATPSVEPDEFDLKMLAELKNPNKNTVPLEKIRERRECNGKISVRVPKELHRKLSESAKENGVSLNQFIVYKLAQN